ncbi:MAG: potassium-transporting ATPase subunit KdpC [Pseudomonadota bacterium]
MLKHLRPALVLLLGFSLLTGVVYPLAVTGIAQLALPKHAAGSLIVDSGTVRGSALIGQPFASEKYFQGRPSAAGTGYDAGASGGSNLGPTSAKLHGQIQQRLAALQASNPGLAVPGELVYASASGLDPDISPGAASFQIPRVAKARGVSAEQLQGLVTRNTQGRALGFLGEPTVNVLALNRALDALNH